jgi:hypothetical protein
MGLSEADTRAKLIGPSRPNEVPEAGIADFRLAPFQDKGGPAMVYRTFGTGLTKLLKELNEVLAA